MGRPKSEEIKFKNTIIGYSQSIKVSDFVVDSTLIALEKLPLEDFFQHTLEGDFKLALKKINLTATPGHTDSKALAALMKSGLIPVLVSVQNNSPLPKFISEKNFSLQTDHGSLVALDVRKVPRSFHKKNYLAPAQNFMVGAAIVVAVAVVVVVLAPGLQGVAPLPQVSSGSTPSPSNSESGPKQAPPRQSTSSGDNSTVVFARFNELTVIDYKNYLLVPQILDPGQKIEALVFFHHTTPSNKYVLDFKLD